MEQDLKDFYEQRKNEKSITKESLTICKLIQDIIEELGIPQKGKYIVLDIGCDDGFFLSKLSSYNPDLVLYGIDLSAEAIEIAQKINKDKNIQFIQEDATTLPFEDNFFDYIISSEILEHIPEYKQAVKEIERVLKPQGKAYLTFPQFLPEHHIFYKHCHYVDKMEGHVKRFTLLEIKEYVSTSDVQHVHYNGGVFDWLYYKMVSYGYFKKILNFFIRPQEKSLEKKEFTYLKVPKVILFFESIKNFITKLDRFIPTQKMAFSLVIQKNKKYKVLFITPDFYPRVGGGENYVLNVAKQFSFKNEVSVFTPNEREAGEKEVFGLNICYLPFYKLFQNKFIRPFLLYKKIRQLSPDILYSSGPSIMDFFVLIIANILHKKKVITYHADLNLQKFSSRLFTKFYFWFCLPFYDRIIVTTEKYKRTLIQRGVNPQKLFFIPPGIEIKNGPPIFKKENNKTQLLFVGALDQHHTYKNVEILINAMSLLNPEVYSLHVVGGGELKEYYQKLAEKFEHVTFLGQVSDQELEKEYTTATILILPSNSPQEGFGMVLLEALSFGCKIITGQNSGGAYLIKEQPTLGLLYNGTETDLAEKIQNLATQNIDAQSIHSFLEKYDWKCIGKEIFDTIK